MTENFVTKVIEICPIEFTKKCPVDDNPNEELAICRKGGHVWLYLGKVSEIEGVVVEN